MSIWIFVDFRSLLKVYFPSPSFCWLFPPQWIHTELMMAGDVSHAETIKLWIVVNSAQRYIQQTQISFFFFTKKKDHNLTEKLINSTSYIKQGGYQNEKWKATGKIDKNVGKFFPFVTLNNLNTIVAFLSVCVVVTHAFGPVSHH